jgi:hypothetical protein
VFEQGWEDYLPLFERIVSIDLPLCLKAVERRRAAMQRIELPPLVLLRECGRDPIVETGEAKAKRSKRPKTPSRTAAKLGHDKASPGSPIAAAARWLTETRQYLVACTSVVAAIGGLWFAVAKAGLPKEVLYAAPVPFLLVFCFTTLPRWYLERQKHWLISRIRPSEGTGQSEAYFQITPYSASQRARYHRADGAHRQILQWLLATPLQS